MALTYCLLLSLVTGSFGFAEEKSSREKKSSKSDDGWSYDAQADWGGSCSDSSLQQSPIRLDESDIDKADMLAIRNLHLGTNTLTIDDFKLDFSVPYLKLDLRDENKSSITIGSSSNNARKCFLQALTGHSQVEHNLPKHMLKGMRDDDSMAFELQYIYKCRDASFYIDQESEAHREYDAYRSKHSGARGAVKKCVSKVFTEDQHSCSKHQSRLITAFLNCLSTPVLQGMGKKYNLPSDAEKAELVDFLHKIFALDFEKAKKDDAEEDGKQDDGKCSYVEQLKQEALLGIHAGFAEKEEELYDTFVESEKLVKMDSIMTRADVSRNVVISVFFINDEKATRNRLLQFLIHVLLLEKAKKEVKQTSDTNTLRWAISMVFSDAALKEEIDWPSVLLASGTNEAILYTGGMTTPPCENPTDWYLLLQPQASPTIHIQALLNLYPKLSNTARSVKTLQKHTRIGKAHIDAELVKTVSFSIRSVKEKRMRLQIFGCAFGVGMIAMLIFHTCLGKHYIPLALPRYALEISIVAMSIMNAMGIISIPTVGQGPVANWAAIWNVIWEESLIDRILHVLLDLLLWVPLLILLLFWSQSALGPDQEYAPWSYITANYHRGAFMAFPIADVILRLLLWLVESPWLVFWLGWLTHCPIVNFLWSVLGQLISAGCVITFPWLYLPIHAYAAERVNCFDGVDWEVHAAFYLACFSRSLIWAALKMDVREEIANRSMIALPCMLMFYLLAEMDMYMDGNFIAVADSCGSEDFTKWGLFALFVGIICMQYIPSLIMTGQAGDSEMVAWTALMYPPELLAEKDTVTVLRANRAYDHNTGRRYWKFEWETVRIDKELMAKTIIVLGLTRSLGEDFLQAAIQYFFTIQVKQNPMIIISIASSIAAFVVNLGKAARFAIFK